MTGSSATNLPVAINILWALIVLFGSADSEVSEEGKDDPPFRAFLLEGLDEYIANYYRPAPGAPPATALPTGLDIEWRICN